MTKHMWEKCAAGLSLITFGISAALPAQTAAPDPWKRVPPTPTSCYADNDFETKLNTALQATVADLVRQNDINAKVQEKFNEMDMMERAQRMQALMMKNPQEAAKMLEAQHAASASGLATLGEVAKTQEKLDKQLADQKKAFDAAVDKAVKPVLARQEVWQTKAKFVGEGVLAAADHAQYVALVQQENAEYEKACAPYFGPKGAFNRWLEIYKTDVIDKRIAVSEAGLAANEAQMRIMDTPTEGYRSLGKLESVRDYLAQLSKISGYRRHKARPTQFQLAK